MSQQRPLPFDRTERLESTWTSLPAQGREQVVVLYAGLIARSTRGMVGAPPQQPSASASQRLVGQAAPERFKPVLGSEAPAKGSPEAELDLPGVAITPPISTEPNGTAIRNFDDSNYN
jgi:hypothetical protein